MKKYLLFLVFSSFLVIETVAQTTKTLDSTLTAISIPDSSKLTMSKVYNDVKAGLSGLASALKVGAEHVYIVLVKQQVTKAYIELVQWFLIPLILLFIAYRLCVVKGNLLSSDMLKESEGLSVIITIFVVGIPLAAILFGCDWSVVLTGFTNPEYGAIKDIMSFIK